ncbi:MAG: hypothetical protein SOW78_01490 [Clostridia bacterium]|nr:hypothetical protein [Clostridia bacterium]
MASVADDGTVTIHKSGSVTFTATADGNYSGANGNNNPPPCKI